MRGRAPLLATAVTAVVVTLGRAGSAHASSGEVGDSGSTNRAYAIAAAMAAVGVALLALTVWFWRSTRPDHPVLAPLEVMGGRKWRNADPIARLRSLDAVRPHGAHATGRVGWLGRPTAPAIDLRARGRDAPDGFEDLLADDAEPMPGAPPTGRAALPQSRIDELEQLLAGLGIDPLPFVHDPADATAGPHDETAAADRPAEVLDPLLRHSDAESTVGSGGDVGPAVR